MAPSPPGRVAGPPTRCAVTHGAGSKEFVDLIAAHDDWVRREFEAIVEAEWGGVVPRCPGLKQGAHWPRRPGYDDRPTSVRCSSEPLTGTRPVVNQRSPPT